jgi:hypothetical protein
LTRRATRYAPPIFPLSPLHISEQGSALVFFALAPSSFSQTLPPRRFESYLFSIDQQVHQPASNSQTPAAKTKQWQHVMRASQSSVTFIDLCGHER